MGGIVDTYLSHILHIIATPAHCAAENVSGYRGCHVEVHTQRSVEPHRWISDHLQTLHREPGTRALHQSTRGKHFKPFYGIFRRTQP